MGIFLLEVLWFASPQECILAVLKHALRAAGFVLLASLRFAVCSNSCRAQKQIGRIFLDGDFLPSDDSFLEGETGSKTQ